MIDIHLIWAQDENGGIGKNGQLPWHISEDLKNFKKITSNSTIIMGRKTWDSLPIKPLPNRENIVLSKSSHLNVQTYKSYKECLHELHIKNINKTIRRAKCQNSTIRYSKVDSFDKLKILAITDGAYLKLEDKTKSVMGRFIFLSNLDESKVVPLVWKSKTIPTVCKSAKDAETRAADKTLEDAVYVARCVKEVYTGDRGEAQITVDLVTDSKPLLDSINSSKQVDNCLLAKWLAAYLYIIPQVGSLILPGKVAF